MIMENFSRATLSIKRDEIMRARSRVRGSMDILKDPTSEYAEHHQHVINTFNAIIDVLDRAIADSEDIGKGV